MSTIAPDEIIDLIGAVRTRHPGIELRLCDSDTKDLRGRLLDDDLELAVYALPGEEPDERIHVMSLFRERMVIVVGPRVHEGGLSPREQSKPFRPHHSF
jgi:DNA-binding transcriptional LysR family regulator